MKRIFRNFMFWLRSTTFGKVVGALLLIGTILAVATLVSNLRNNEDEADVEEFDTVMSIYSIGGLDENGQYVKTNKSLYTKKAKEADVVKTTLDFDNNIEYEIFFYDEVGDFVESTGLQSSNNTFEMPSGATHFRVVITPIWNDDVEEDKQKVTLLNQLKFSTQLKVEIQIYDFETLNIGYASSEDVITIKYEVGMTWGQWVDSSYNTLGCKLTTTINGPDKPMTIQFDNGLLKLTSSDIHVVENDLIDGSASYYIYD